MECAPSSVNILLTNDFPEAIPPVSPILSIVPLDESISPQRQRVTEKNSKAATDLRGSTQINLSDLSLLTTLSPCFSEIRGCAGANFVGFLWVSVSLW